MFEDETDLLLFPPLRAAWALRGQETPVPISGVNAKRVVYGILNIKTGNEHSSHTAAGTQRLATQLNMEFLWLPNRSPHLNPMDHMWRHGKEVICANWQYPTIEDQVEAFFLYLYELTPREALRKASVLSENFWLD